ncbi:MAG: hypothetical protein AB7E85_04905 [Pseudobdellovibrionaceae bacterium]
MNYRRFFKILLLSCLALGGLAACSSCAHAEIFRLAQAQTLTDRTASSPQTTTEATSEPAAEVAATEAEIVEDVPQEAYAPEKPNVNEKLFYMESSPKDVGALLETILTQTKDQLLPYIALHTDNQSYVGQLLQIQGHYALIRVPGNADGAYNAQPYSGTSQIDTYDYIDLTKVEGFSLETRSR